MDMYLNWQVGEKTGNGMNLRALLFCSDEKIVRVLRRVLGDLDVAVEHCPDVDSATQKLTRSRFEAVIVDCADEQLATRILGSARYAPCNKRAIAVALVEGQTALRGAFNLGAHFVLYKPISSERAKTSFRAARALMKRERRRNMRVAVEFPIALQHSTGQLRTTTADLSEGGVAITGITAAAARGVQRAQFKLPGTNLEIDCKAEVAWENAHQVGLRLVDVSPDVQVQLKDWVNRHSPEPEKDDPPVQCKLTDLSVGGCYLEIASPFPVPTRVILSMKSGDVQVQAEGVVRVMHPERGMGVEFTQSTSQQREHVEKFIQLLASSDGVVPELVVEPQGLEAANSRKENVSGLADPLVQLFRDKSDLATEAFLNELRAQRSNPESAAAASAL
jgi:c-di-GMP-binding flagellar brake protein YcgR